MLRYRVEAWVAGHEEDETPDRMPDINVLVQASSGPEALRVALALCNANEADVQDSNVYREGNTPAEEERDHKRTVALAALAAFAESAANLSRAWDALEGADFDAFNTRYPFGPSFDEQVILIMEWRADVLESLK